MECDVENLHGRDDTLKLVYTSLEIFYTDCFEWSEQDLRGSLIISFINLNKKFIFTRYRQRGKFPYHSLSFLLSSSIMWIPNHLIISNSRLDLSVEVHESSRLAGTYQDPTVFSLNGKLLSPECFWIALNHCGLLVFCKGRSEKTFARSQLD